MLSLCYELNMLTNYHTHSTFCDGRSTLEETVLAAIERGFSALGFSGHGYTAFDVRTSMTDTRGYISEVNRLKERYKNEIQIYLGVEEDMLSPVERTDFEYIIGSSHYMHIGGRYYPLDLSRDNITDLLEIFDQNPVAMAEAYYGRFAAYLKDRRPDVVGHFDLLTKFDERLEPIFLGNLGYNAVAEKYLDSLAGDGLIFEVNTGAISRGYRTTPYPAENLLYILKRRGAGIILSSDCHRAEWIDCNFTEMKQYLRDIGFREAYALYDREFIKYKL